MAKKKTTKKTTKKKAVAKKVEPKAAEKKAAKKVTIKTSHLVVAGLAIAIIAVLGAYMWIGAPEPGVDETVAQMDHVYVTYSGSFTNGTVFDEGEIDFDVGAGQMIPCFEDNVLGMELGEEKTFTCPPDTAYGNYDTSLVEQVDRQDSMDRIITTEMEMLETFTEDNITTGATINVRGVDWPMTVTSVVGENVTLRHEPILNETYYPVNMPTFVIIGLTEDNITIQYKFEVGDDVPGPLGWGKISDVTEDTIIIDFNHPLAGKTLMFTVTVDKIVKPDSGSATGMIVLEADEEGNVQTSGFAPQTFDEKSGNEVCEIGGKPVVRLFSTTTCGHCSWVGEPFDEVAKEYVDAGKIVAYHWQLDTGDNTLTDEVETEVPESEIAVYQEFNPRGTIPTFVFGCKYYRIGSGYEREENGKELEKDEYRAIIEEFLK